VHFPFGALPAASKFERGILPRQSPVLVGRTVVDDVAQRPDAAKNGEVPDDAGRAQGPCRLKSVLNAASTVSTPSPMKRPWVSSSGVGITIPLVIGPSANLPIFMSFGSSTVQLIAFWQIL
jgi:hypothetical protein